MHKLLTDKPGEKMLLLGNEAIARGGIEAGVAFTSTYPGTPSSEISLQFFQTSQESDLYFEYSTNERWPWKWQRQLLIPVYAACAS